MRTYNPECDPDFWDENERQEPMSEKDSIKCEVSKYSSRACERGTKGCKVRHEDSIEARAQAFINTPERGRITFDKLAAFAQQELDRQVSDAVEKREREIADELEKLGIHRLTLTTYIDQLRGQSK